MSHYIERLQERMTPAEASALVAAVAKLARTLDESLDYAVHIMRLPDYRGSWTIDPDGSGISNGNNVWAIIRHGRVATVMLRRDAQPSTKEAFRVDRVGKAKV